MAFHKLQRFLDIKDLLLTRVEARSSYAHAAEGRPEPRKNPPHAGPRRRDEVNIAKRPVAIRKGTCNRGLLVYRYLHARLANSWRICTARPIPIVTAISSDCKMLPARRILPVVG